MWPGTEGNSQPRAREKLCPSSTIKKELNYILQPCELRCQPVTS